MRRYLHHLFVPRESNNHRAKLLHHDSLLLVITILLFCASLFSVVQNNFPSVLGISANIAINDLLNLTNQARLQNSVAPLHLNQELAEAATAKARNMFQDDYWAHIAPDGTTPWVFIKNSGYDYLYAGENLARGYDTATDVVNAWMASPEHRANMLSPNYTDVGFAVATGNLTGSPTVLVVEEFGSPYLTQDESTSSTQVSLNNLSPTPATVQAGVISTSNNPTPTFAIMTPPPASDNTAVKNPFLSVMSLRSQPLLNGNSTGFDLAFFLIILFVGAFIIDAIIIERNKIARAVSHNLDHIIFLLIILIAAVLLSRGIVL